MACLLISVIFLKFCLTINRKTEMIKGMIRPIMKQAAPTQQDKFELLLSITSLKAPQMQLVCTRDFSIKITDENLIDKSNLKKKKEEIRCYQKHP